MAEELTQTELEKVLAAIATVKINEDAINSSQNGGAFSDAEIDAILEATCSSSVVMKPKGSSVT